MALPLLAAGAGALVGGFLSIACFGAGSGDVISKTLNRIFQARIVTERDLVRMRTKGQITQDDFESLMKYCGYAPVNANALLASYPDQLSTTEALVLWHRYKDEPENALGINREWLDKRLTQAGIDKRVLDETIEANRPVPLLQDIITFAVRDVFEKEAAELAGLFQGMPDDYLKEAKKRGLSESDARLYWGAHWSLPGINHVYEMLHRLYPGSGYSTTFTDDDMDTFFNLADIAPGFRERLKAISYSPLTRVDIRRIYAMGLWGDGQAAKARLIREYRQIGYAPDNAAILADFTIQSYGAGRKRFTRSQIESFYINKIWEDQSAKKAETELLKIGYDPDQAKLILRMADLKHIDAEEKAKIEAIREQWINGIIETEAELHTKLIAVPLEQSKVASLMKQFEAEKTKRQSRLTRADVQTLYREGIISEKEFRRFFANLGYIEKDIDLLIKLMGKGKTYPDKLPTLENVLEWYQNDFINDVRFVRTMRRIGFRDEWIVLYAESAGKPLDEKLQEEMEIPDEQKWEKL